MQNETLTTELRVVLDRIDETKAKLEESIKAGGAQAHANATAAIAKLKAALED